VQAAKAKCHTQVVNTALASTASETALNVTVAVVLISAFVLAPVMAVVVQGRRNKSALGPGVCPTCGRRRVNTALAFCSLCHDDEHPAWVGGCRRCRERYLDFMRSKKAAQESSSGARQPLLPKSQRAPLGGLAAYRKTSLIVVLILVGGFFAASFWIQSLQYATAQELIADLGKQGVPCRSVHLVTPTTESPIRNAGSCRTSDGPLHVIVFDDTDALNRRSPTVLSDVYGGNYAIVGDEWLVVAVAQGLASRVQDALGGTMSRIAVSTPESVPVLPVTGSGTDSLIGGDIDCFQVGHPVYVGAYDPNGLDADNDGIGCESW
jgi:hypothetical protein